MIFPTKIYSNSRKNNKDFSKVNNPGKWALWLDNSMVTIGLISPLMAVPQI